MSQHQRDKQAYLNATPMQREVVRLLLCDVLGCLRAQYLSYQTSHWQVVGQSFYGNHLLFERLYSSVLLQIDSLAEKLVGYLGRDVVDLTGQMEKIWDYTSVWSQIGCHHKRGIRSEQDIQAALQRAYDGIKQVKAMTLGLDDWIMATANTHEENEYLLQQALTPVPGQKQASTDEGYFYDAPDHHVVLDFAKSRAITNDVLDSARQRQSYRQHLKIYSQKIRISINKKAPTNAFLKTEESDSLFGLLARQLTRRQSQAVTMRYRDNCSLPEIAAAMGVDRHTVSRYLSSGLKRLRGVLAIE